MELKKYALYWTAEICGVQVVEALDEDDASEQFDPQKYVDDLPDEPICANLECVSIYVEKPKKKRKSK